MIGHPVWLGDDSGSAVSGGGGGYDYTAADEDEERGRSKRREMEKESLLKEALYEDTLSPQSSSIPPSLSRQPSPSGYPMNASRSPSTSQLPQPSFTSSQHSHISLNGSGRLVSFNFVCIIDTPPDSHLSSHLEGYYKDVIVPLTANIKALERREMWLGKETAKLRRTLESDMEKGVPPIEHLASLPSISPLAAAISQLYTALKSSLLATISLGSLPVQVLLRGEIPMEEADAPPDRDRDQNPVDREEQDGDRARSASPSPPEGFQQRRLPLFSRLRRRPPVKFQPWETLLPLEDPEESKREVEEGTLLWRFLDICSPTLSFGEYETLLDVETEGFPLSEIVEHLVHWRKGRIIDVVSLKGFYAIYGSFDTKLLPSLDYKFRIAFPTLPSLLILLSQIPPNDSFSSIVPSPSQRALFLSALIWLLTNDIVVKQRVYVRIVVSSTVKSDSSIHWGSALRGRGGGGITGGGSSAADSTTDDGTLEEGSTTSSVFNDEIGSVTSNDSGGSVLGIRRQISKPDLDDSRGMTISGGSALSISPSLGRSPLGGISRSFSRSFQTSSMKLGSGGTAGSGSGSGLMKGQRKSKRTMSTTTFSSTNSVDGGDEEQKGRPSVILEPGRPSALESRWLVEICREKDKSVVEKFERIIRMLNGTVQLDEIRHRASLSRKDIRLILSAFESHLVLFTHP